VVIRTRHVPASVDVGHFDVPASHDMVVLPLITRRMGGGCYSCESRALLERLREGLPMPEYAVKVKLSATVRVRATDEMVARRVATSLLLSLTADDIRIPNDNDATSQGNATVREASFSMEGCPSIVAIGVKRAKRFTIKGR
jgi:hypothetical protein